VDAPQVVPGAHGDAVVARIAAAAGAEQEMVVVKIAPRSAGRHRAAPAVAREDRIAVARLRAPLVVYVVEEALEAPPGGFRRQDEARDRAAKEDGDRFGGEERDVGVDGVRRFFVIVPLPASIDTGLYVGFGIVLIFAIGGPFSAAGSPQ